MGSLRGIEFIEIICSDVEASARWYGEQLGFTSIDGAPPDSRWLDAGNTALRLATATPEAQAGGWEPDDIQRGIRHLGFKVADVDAHAERLRNAGVDFAVDPKDATGGVRITFFSDPDGNRLELVQGALEYHRTFSPEIAARERAALPEPGDPPRFDHVAVTVADLEASLRLYRDELDFDVVGQLAFEDARGFLITYLKSGPTGLELFSWDAPTRENPAASGAERLGFAAIGIGVGADAPMTVLEPDGVALALIAAR